MVGGRVRGGPLAGERRLGPWKALSLHGLMVESVSVWERVELRVDTLLDDRGARASAPSVGWWQRAPSFSWSSRAKRTGWREIAQFSGVMSVGIHARLECSSLKCGLQKSTRRISGRCAEGPSGFAADRPSDVGAEALFDERVAEQAERKGARYLRPALRPGEACRSNAQAEDSADDGRRLGAYQHYSLTRIVSERSWSQRSSDGVPAGLRSRDGRVPNSSAGERVGTHSVVSLG
jgi:hypothetical protein